MTIVTYAHCLASRIPELARDCTANNAYMIAKELEELFRELRYASETTRIDAVRDASEQLEA